MYNDDDLLQEEVINNIKKISEQINEEMDKDDINDEKIFKLRYAQFIQGLYLNLNNKLYNI